MQREVWRNADDKLNCIIAEVASPHATCSPLDGICAIGVCMSRLCFGNPFWKNALNEKKSLEGGNTEPNFLIKKIQIILYVMRFAST